MMPVTPTFSPQGDGNAVPSLKWYQLKPSHTYLFPARGRKLAALVGAVSAISVTPTFSPQGDGNKKDGGTVAANGYLCHTYLFPARGRKHMRSRDTMGSDLRSHLPFPRKGTETTKPTKPSSPEAASHLPFPRKGTETGRSAHGVGFCPVTPTFSPQGDGNTTLWASALRGRSHTYLFPARGRKLMVFLVSCRFVGVTPTFSPQGDGN